MVVLVVETTIFSAHRHIWCCWHAADKTGWTNGLCSKIELHMIRPFRSMHMKNFWRLRTAVEMVYSYDEGHRCRPFRWRAMAWRNPASICITTHRNRPRELNHAYGWCPCIMGRQAINGRWTGSTTAAAATISPPYCSSSSFLAFWRWWLVDVKSKTLGKR